MSGIGHLKIADAPIAVVDVETTGLHPNGDRIIEIAVIRVDPGSPPRIVVDTLVNPERAVSATEIHGITDSDVRDAPTFREIAREVARALSGCVFASFNVYFDSRFVANEFQRAAFTAFPPHLCLMYLRPGLGIGRRCTLADACSAHGIAHSYAHFAADDALAGSELWLAYVRQMTQLQINTYEDLGNRLSYKFVQSFTDPLLDVLAGDGHPISWKSRRAGRVDTASRPLQPQPVKRLNPIAEYWDALKACLADLNVTSEEIRYLKEKRQLLGLNDAQVRSLHARAFAGVLASVSDDHAIDDHEVDKIAIFADGLRTLGWSPGDRIASAASGQRQVLPISPRF